MKSKEVVTLSKEQETLLIPLFGKASYQTIFQDQKAREILNQIDYDFNSLQIPKKTSTTLVLRAKKLDEVAAEFIKNNPDGVILHLGCGLDSRCIRLQHSNNHWFDLDFPDVIALRKKFYQEDDRYKMIASSVTESTWLDQIPDSREPYLIIAEGLFMYLNEQNIKELFHIWKHKFTYVEIVFDAFSEYTVKHIVKHPSLQKTGAHILWGIDDAKCIEKWDPDYSLIEEWFFNDSHLIQKLDPFYRFMFKLTSKIDIAKKAQRILHYRL